MSQLTRLSELRRALPLVAAALLLVAIALPMWRITLEAPQYPGRSLLVELYAYPRLEGDVREVQMLNHYVGFYYPDPVFLEPNYAVHENAIAVPEWSFGPLPFVALAAIGAFVAFAPTVRKLKLGLTCLLVGTTVVFVSMFALIQYRLYQAGHALDPEAPLRGVEGFTPPLFGTYEVANISGLAWFGLGGYLTVIALALIAVAFLYRDTDSTVGDLPELVRSIPGRVRDRPTWNRIRERSTALSTRAAADPTQAGGASTPAAANDRRTRPSVSADDRSGTDGDPR